MLEKFVKKVTGYFTSHDHLNGKDILIDDDVKMSKKLDKNIEILKASMGGSVDFIVREINSGDSKLAFFYIDGLIDSMKLEQNILKPLLSLENSIESIEDLVRKYLPSSEIKITEKLSEACQGFLSGDTVIMVNGISNSVIVNTKGYETRSVNDPQTDSVIKGPREGFIENIRTNTALIRRKIKDTSLRLESFTVGERSKTAVAIMYIKDVANPELIKKIRDKINEIEVDAIYDSGYIQQYIECNPGSLFDTVGYTEKPDIAAAKIMEGRVAILVDGSPFVLTAPMLFIESFQSPEDYYIHPAAATSLRIVRFLSYFISILALPLYVAIATFHHEMAPLSLMYTMAASEADTPFPVVIEAVLMIITFEILKESGVRLPKPVGQAVSIVGALVIGESAVTAGFIAAPMVIAVAITAVSAFVIPTQANAMVLLRYIMLFLSGTMGGFGITIGILFFLMHLTSLRSFGIPYLSSFAPYNTSDMKDTLIRAPLYTLLTRPSGLTRNNPRRQKFKKIWENKNEKN